MTAYFIRRFLLIIPTFVGITIMVFIVTRFVPGGPIERIIAQAQQMPSIQGGAGAFVDRIEGSYTNVVGLPLPEVLVAVGGVA